MKKVPSEQRGVTIPPMTTEEQVDKRKPIGRYHLEIREYGMITLVRDDGYTWSDEARAMSHLMKELTIALAQGEKQGAEKERKSKLKTDFGSAYTEGYNQGRVYGQEKMEIFFNKIKKLFDALKG